MKNICQSCGMPLKKDPEQGGTNADGSKSGEYCSYCYKNGKFEGTENFTVTEMQKYCCEKMHNEHGFSRPIAWLFTRNMKRLGRWKGK